MARDFSECKDPENFKLFQLVNGRKFMARKNGCLFCTHFDELLYDSHGIYAIFCDCSFDTDIGMSGQCANFKECNNVSRET